MRRIGVYESVSFADPVVGSVIETMGGWIRLGDMLQNEEKWKQKEFERLYEILVVNGGHHPKSLPGIMEMENAVRGYKVTVKPVLIGAQQGQIPAVAAPSGDFKG